ISAFLNAVPAALIASPVIGPVRKWLTNSFGIEGSLATARSIRLALLGITRLLGVGYVSHTEFRTGSGLVPAPDQSISPSSSVAAWPGSVKSWVLAMLAAKRRLRVAPVPPRAVVPVHGKDAPR